MKSVWISHRDSFALSKNRWIASSLPKNRAQPTIYGTRFAKVGRFPFVIVFCEFEDKLVVIAVAHVRRMPGYWRKRKL